jgi:3-deoxy-manno-octulosonate cytidylyltransferase (CMP-KDO synthetase)
MNILGVVPARYNSTRLPGKPLLDICGKPMVWWVYQQALQASGFSSVVVAIDDERVESVCKELGIEYLMTSPHHVRHIDRIHEVSNSFIADYYVSICGDEPLVEPREIERVSALLPTPTSSPVIRSLMRTLDNQEETVDPNNIKVAVSSHNSCLFLTRSLIPYPYMHNNGHSYKLVGVECYNKPALDFFVNSRMTPYEEIEDITLMRFIENDIPVELIHTDIYELGVDTQHDLEQVRNVMGRKLMERKDL